MKIQVNTVEGKTNKAGSKQGRTYNVNEASERKGFFDAVSDTGKEFSIWNLNGDWSKIGIMRKGVRRMSYSTDFEIL